MSAETLFIELDGFGNTMGLVMTSQGADYQDVRGSYEELSRLVVAWLAKASPDELARVYESGGWRGTPNLRSLQMAARMWYAANCPERVIRCDSGQA